MTPREEAAEYPVFAEPRPEPRGQGWVLFAAIMLAIAGILNIIYGIVGLANSVFFTEAGRFVAYDLRFWSWIILGLGIIELIAAGSLLSGRQWARWFAIAVASVNIIGHMLAIQAYPFWSLLFIALDVLVIYGLAAYGGRWSEYRRSELERATLT